MLILTVTMGIIIAEIIMGMDAVPAIMVVAVVTTVVAVVAQAGTGISNNFLSFFMEKV